MYALSISADSCPKELFQWQLVWSIRLSLALFPGSRQSVAWRCCFCLLELSLSSSFHKFINLTDTTRWLACFARQWQVRHPFGPKKHFRWWRLGFWFFFISHASVQCLALVVGFLAFFTRPAWPSLRTVCVLLLCCTIKSRAGSYTQILIFIVEITVNICNRCTSATLSGSTWAHAQL